MLNPALMDKCLFIPAWWLPSYCAAMSNPRPRSKEDSQAKANGINAGTMLPDGDAEQNLVMLAAVSMLQAQLLKTPEKTLVQINAKDLRKRVTVEDQSIATVIQAMPQLRILSANTQGILQPLHLFVGEQWLASDTARGDMNVQMQLAGPGAELLLGYVDGYAEFLRVVAEKTLLTPLLPGHAPLMLWKSVWADLSGAERLLYVRLEKAMQWDFRWLQLDGIFGITLDELFEDLYAPAPKAAGADSEEFAWRRKLLDRVGKKLADHGLMQPHVDAHYLAVGADRSSDFNIAWQISQGRLVSEDTASYQDAALRALLVQRSASSREKLVEMFAVDESMQVSLRGMMQTVLEIANKRPQVAVATPKNGSFVDLATLFVEWSARITARAGMPLPENVRQSYFAQFVGPSFSSTLEERFLNFLTAATEAAPQLVTLLREPGATFAVDDTHALPEFKEYLKSKRRRPEVVIPKPAPTPVLEPVAAPVAAKAEPTPQAPYLNKAPSFNIKRLAGEELAKMRHKDPKRYLELKQTYLRSLEPTRKKMILEVQQQMQPDKFDEHLKHSLIKFMLENPSSWSSAARMH